MDPLSIFGGFAQAGVPVAGALGEGYISGARQAVEIQAQRQQMDMNRRAMLLKMIMQPMEFAKAQAELAESQARSRYLDAQAHDEPRKVDIAGRNANTAAENADTLGKLRDVQVKKTKMQNDPLYSTHRDNVKALAAAKANEAHMRQQYAGANNGPNGQAQIGRASAASAQAQQLYLQSKAALEKIYGPEASRAAESEAASPAGAGSDLSPLGGLDPTQWGQ